MKPRGLRWCGRLTENELARLMKLPRSEKIVVSAPIALDFPAKGIIAVDIDSPSWGRRPAWPPSAGFVVV